MLSDEHYGLPVAIYKASDFFGEMEIFANEKRHFSCWAYSDCILIALKKEMYSEIFYKKYPSLGKAFKKIINIRFNHFVELCLFADELLSQKEGASLESFDSEESVRSEGEFRCSISEMGMMGSQFGYIRDWNLIYCGDVELREIMRYDIDDFGRIDVWIKILVSGVILLIWAWT